MVLRDHVLVLLVHVYFHRCVILSEHITIRTREEARVRDNVGARVTEQNVVLHRALVHENFRTNGTRQMHCTIGPASWVHAIGVVE